MNNYRIYVDGDFDKKLLTIKNDIESTFNTLDNIIESAPNKHIIVIEHNIELDQDSIFLVYCGNQERYLLDKQKILLKEAVKMRRELLHQESTKVTRTFGTNLQDKSCLELKREIIDLSQKKGNE